MKMLTILFLMVIGMILLVNNVKAVSTVQWNISFSDANDLFGNACTVSGGELICTGYNSTSIVHKAINISTNSVNATFEFRIKFSAWGADYHCINFHSANTTPPTLVQLVGRLVSGTGSGVKMFRDSDSVSTIWTGVNTLETYYTLKVVYLLNRSFQGYVDGTYIGNHPWEDISSNATWIMIRNEALCSFTMDWFAHYNTSETAINSLPTTNNVSITPLPLEANTNAKGHANYSDIDNDVSGGNQTYWYINKTLITEANNSFNLLSGNVTLNANITFSARFNDTIAWSSWVNSTTITAGDTTAPILNNCTLSATSITDASGNTINFTCNAQDTFSNIQSMVAYLNGTLNKTLTFSFTQSLNVVATYTIFGGSETLTVGSYSISQVNVTDTSNNKLSNTTRDLHFQVTSAPSGDGGQISSGGGGGTITIIKEKLIGAIPILSFGGITTTDFIVISTPRKQIKILRFTNLGNTTFENGIIFIEGDAKKYIKPYVCNLNLQDCKDIGINIKSQESLFLLLNGTFTEGLQLGSQGVVKLQEKKENGQTYEINLLIARPPLYKLAIKPFSEYSGLNEMQSLIIVYVLTSLSIITIVYVILL